MIRAVPYLVITVIFASVAYAGYIGTVIDVKPETAESLFRSLAFEQAAEKVCE